MDDMKTFEHRLASELERIAGPRRAVDSRSIRQAATGATPVRPWSALPRRIGIASAFPGRSPSMFSAAKLFAGAAIVALFGGFLLSGILTQQPDTQPGPASASASPTPGPTRVDVPEAGFAVTFPTGWNVRVEPVTPAAVPQGRFDLMAIVYAADVDEDESCELSAYLGRVDGTDSDVEQVSLETETASRRLCEEGEFIPSLCDWEFTSIPAGSAALEVFTERWDFGAVPHPGAQWLTTDGSDLYRLVCSSGDPPDDYWRPIMESFEFLPVERSGGAEPASITAAQLGTNAVTEQVEPGVLRVIHDGVRPLEEPESVFDGWRQLRIDSEGVPWLFGEDAFARLGVPGTHLLSGVPTDVEFAPDGGVWMGIGSAAVHVFDGSTWTDWPLPAGNDDQASTHGRVNLEILADGTVWANSRDVITRLDEGGWTAVESPMGQLYPMRASDTEIWVDGPPNGITDQDGTLYRFDGADWEAFETPEGYIGRGSIWGSAPVGADGTLWVSFHRSPPGGTGERSEIPTGIARFDGSGWEEWEAADFPDEGALDPVDGDWNFEGIGPDRSLWALPYECKGVGRFDGTTVNQYLAGRCVGAMDVGPDGSAWLVTVTQGGDPEGIYVIKPDDASTMEWPLDEDGRPRASQPMGIRPHR